MVSEHAHSAAMISILVTGIQTYSPEIKGETNNRIPNNHIRHIDLHKPLIIQQQIIEVDLTATYNYLVELGEEYMTENDLDGHLEFYGYLKESTDPDTGVVKDAGIFKGPMQDLALVHVFYDTPWDGSAAEPFPGATNDTWSMVAVLEELFFAHVPMVPTVTRSSATLYAPNVVIEWPAYSSAFAWGANRYRYLDTDPDFQ